MFNPFKKKEDSPPDVGQEEAYDAKNKGKEENKKESDEPELSAAPEVKKTKKQISVNAGKDSSNELNKLEFEKIYARIEAINSWLKQFQERSTYVSERLGEIRTMNMQNEKKIIGSTKEATKVIEMFKEIKPEELNSSYRKMEMKVITLSEKIDANKQFVENVLDEFKELRNRADIFVGTEGLLKLNEDVKKDLIEVQKLGSKVRLHADKSEQLFVELKKGFAENKKLSVEVNQVSSMFPELKKDIDKLRIDFSNIVSLKEDVQKLSNSVETVLSIAKTNKNDIEDIAATIGDANIRRIGDYEYKMASILQIIDTLAGQVSQIKKKVGINEKSTKINVSPSKKEIIGDDNINMTHMKLHPQITKNLIPQTNVNNPYSKIGGNATSSVGLPQNNISSTVQKTDSLSNGVKMQQTSVLSSFAKPKTNSEIMRETIQTNQKTKNNVPLVNNVFQGNQQFKGVKQDSLTKNQIIVQDIKKLIGEGNLSLDKGDYKRAKEIYQKAWGEYGYLEYENEGLYHGLLDLYNSLEKFG